MKKNNKKAFSLAETVIALLIVGVLTGVFVPVISKMQSIRENSRSCQCNTNEYCNISDDAQLEEHRCKPCSDIHEDCIECIADRTYTPIPARCTKCQNGKIPSQDGRTCIAAYADIRQAGFYITKYNLNDYKDIQTGFNSYNAGETCSGTTCCWKGATSGSGCTTKVLNGYAGCERTLCNYETSESVCNGLKLISEFDFWQLPKQPYLYALSKLPSYYQAGLGVDGLMLCANTTDTVDNIDICPQNAVGVYTYQPYSLSAKIPLSSGQFGIINYDFNGTQLDFSSYNIVSSLADINTITSTRCIRPYCTGASKHYNITSGQCEDCSAITDPKADITSCDGTALYDCVDGYYLKFDGTSYSCAQCNSRCKKCFEKPNNVLYCYECISGDPNPDGTCP